MLKRTAAALQRLAGPAGPWLNRVMALLLAVWATHGVLRVALLFRTDGFGFPIVGKPDWYIFHALFLDLHWIFLWSLPIAVLLALAARFAPRLCRPLFALLILFHAAVLLFTVIDHETLRFMGMHFDPGLARTYGNSAAVHEVFRFLAHDASVRGLPYVLFFGCIPCALGLYALLARTAWARSRTWSLRPVGWVLVGCLVGYLYVYFIWTGGNRMKKLRPFVQSVYLSLSRKPTPSLSRDSLDLLAGQYQRAWQAGQGGGDAGWVFPNRDYPYYREPVEFHCASLARNGGTPDPVCSEDSDGDGYPKSRDCNDADPRVHPGAAEIDGDGVDQDCSGADGKPWNFVLFFLESHRAVNVGHLNPYGSLYSATPFLDSLARTGQYWTRFIASGIPTINALVSIHLSIPQLPTQYISSEFTDLKHEAFTAVLARHGYATHFFSAADPAWDNQTPWLRQWYQGFTYHRTQETDWSTFQNMYAWMRDSLPKDKPFCVSVMSKTNHYPFNPVPGVKRLPDSASLVDRMNATMAYTDAGMRVFVDSLRRLPSFNHTVILVIADHGFPLSEHGSSNIGHGLYTESVWLPLVISGHHPKLGPPRAHQDLAAEMDLGPTILDLAGIREPNAYTGHSLLSPAPFGRQMSFLLREEQAIVERGPWRWHGAWGAVPREQGEEIFNLLEDRMERHNRMPEQPDFRDSASIFVRGFARLHQQIVEKNTLWPR